MLYTVGEDLVDVVVGRVLLRLHAVLLLDQELSVLAIRRTAQQLDVDIDLVKFLRYSLKQFGMLDYIRK